MATATEETVEGAIDQRRARSFITRFHKLREQASKLDYELAGLAQEIRQQFPKGASGDSQCRLWMCWHLDVYGQTAVMLVRAAKAFTLFPDEASWVNVGGWQSIGFLLGFKAAQRRKIHKHAMRLAADRDRPVGYSTVRNLAHTLGCRQVRSLGGRPNRLAVEEDLGLLRTFLAERIKDGTITTEEMPEGVLLAMKPTRLSEIESALSA